MLPAEELSWRFSRSSGPGGQGVNTADSRVELSWDAERSRALAGPLRERVLEQLQGRLVDGVLTVRPETPFDGVAPGQTAVLYDGTRVIGQFTIDRTVSAVPVEV